MRIPAAVFSGVSQRCTIWLSGNGQDGANSTPMYRWRSAARPNLIGGINYTNVGDAVKGTRGIPKVGNHKTLEILNAIAEPQGKKQREIFATGRVGGVRIGFSQVARNFVSAFREDPPCLDASNLKMVPASQNGDLRLANDSFANAALSVLLGETLFSYWLSLGDGFHVTGGVLKDFLKALNHLDTSSFDNLATLGAVLHSRRHEALAFKKNAGKYVGNFNYRILHDLTRRADMVLLMGLKITPDAALGVLGDVQRVLAINEFAGERGIPPAVKETLLPLPRDIAAQEQSLRSIDATVLPYYNLTKTEFEFLLKRDVVLYDAVGGKEGSEMGEVEDE